MTKQVRFASDPGLRLNESELNFLLLLERAGGSLVSSYGALGAKMGIKGQSARQVVRSMCERDYATFYTRFLPNGGQLENEYLLTNGGRELLATWRANRRA